MNRDELDLQAPLLFSTGQVDVNEWTFSGQPKLDVIMPAVAPVASSDYGAVYGHKPEAA